MGPASSFRSNIFFLAKNVIDIYLSTYEDAFQTLYIKLALRSFEIVRTYLMLIIALNMRWNLYMTGHFNDGSEQEMVI